MSIIIRVFGLPLVISLLLSGCQHTPSVKNNVPIATQLQQLSSLIAAARYLKNQCHLADIPQDERLLNTALQMAEHRGWQTKAPEYQRLSVMSEETYQALVKESAAGAQQCAQFSFSARPFIERARDEKKG